MDNGKNANYVPLQHPLQKRPIPKRAQEKIKTSEAYLFQVGLKRKSTGKMKEYFGLIDIKINQDHQKIKIEAQLSQVGLKQ
jgi:hypothetical protein